RVWVRRQPVGRLRDLLPEAVEMRLIEPAFQKRPRIDTRRTVPLEEHLVAGLAALLAAEEVVEPDLVEAGARRVRRDVPADVGRGVGAGHHDRCVPADVSADAALDELV